MIRAAVVLAATGVILLFVVKFIGLPAVVFGDSMVPTLRTWDVCWLQRARPYAPARGDIIMFRTADDPPLRFIKRVIALPGETIAIQAGQVLINNQPVLGITGGALTADESKPGPIYLQGDHTGVDYRNVVLRPIAK